jgi:hypothetical protein
MQKQELVIESIFEGLFVSEDYSRRLAAELFFRMNPILIPPWGFDAVFDEALVFEESYRALLRFG